MFSYNYLRQFTNCLKHFLMDFLCKFFTLEEKDIKYLFLQIQIIIMVTSYGKKQDFLKAFLRYRELTRHT